MRLACIHARVVEGSALPLSDVDRDWVEHDLRLAQFLGLASLGPRLQQLRALNYFRGLAAHIIDIIPETLEQVLDALIFEHLLGLPILALLLLLQLLLLLLLLLCFLPGLPGVETFVQRLADGRQGGVTR